MTLTDLLPANLIRSFKTWVELGVSSELTDTERRRQYIVNATPLMVLVAVLFYMVLSLLVGNAALVWTTVYELPVPLAGVIWFRMRQHQHRPASYWSASFICQATVLVGIFTGQGTYFKTHLYFLYFSLGAALIIPITHRKRLVLVSMECMAVYLALDYFQWPASAGVMELSGAMAKLSEVVVTVSCTAILFFAFCVSESFSETLEAKLRTMASTDTLTQLANRRTFHAALARAAAHAERNSAPLCLAMLDVDYFKRVNDSYGHDAGDDVLKHVAQVLMRTARSGDLVARFGGEEFVVLMQDCTADNAVVAGERMRAALQAEPCVTGSQTIAVTASLGIAQWYAGMDKKQLITTADNALYRAKQAGRNRVELAALASSAA